MTAINETILTTLPGNSETERVIVVLCTNYEDHSSHLELRQETWAANLGWYTQHSIRLNHDQTRDLRQFLGSHRVPAAAKHPNVPSQVRSRNHTSTASHLRIVQADSA